MWSRKLEKLHCRFHTNADALLQWAVEGRETVNDENAEIAFGAGDDEVQRVLEVSRNIHTLLTPFMSSEVFDTVLNRPRRGSPLKTQRK